MTYPMLGCIYPTQSEKVDISSYGRCNCVGYEMGKLIYQFACVIKHEA